jgi:MFS family permease
MHALFIGTRGLIPSHIQIHERDGIPPKPPAQVQRARRLTNRLADEMGGSGHWRAITVCCMACVAPLLFGYTLGFTSPSLLYMEISESAVFPVEVTAASGVSSTEAAKFGALVNVGAMAGALAGGPLSDRLGRRPAIASCAAVWIVAWLTLSTATTTAAAHAARILTGVAVGVASGTVPVFIAEIAPAAIRGALGAANQLGVVSGILL